MTRVGVGASTWLTMGMLVFAFGCGGRDDGDRRMPRCGDPGVICVDGGPDTGPPTADGGGTDAPSDSTRTDTGRPDASGGSCDIGEPCTSTRGCRISTRCVDEISDTIGGMGDEIVGHPSGVTSIPQTLFTGGYCTVVGIEGMGGCTIGDDSTCCEGGGAVCANAGTQMGRRVTFCVAACNPSTTSNPCRDTYACDLGLRGCVPGCATDDECRIYRADTNRDGRIEAPAAGAMAVDRLTYDTESRATCNRTTYRCEHPAGPGMPHAGIPCERDSQCEENGDCISEAGSEGAWPGGYCIKFGCDLPGVTCARGGHCQERRVGVHVCLQDCKVADHGMGGMFAPHATCRAGYMCAWDGVGGPSAMVNGGCLPGNFNDVRTPNVGAACDADSDCYSPFGAGGCIEPWGTEGYCSIFDCSAPGYPADICGSGAVCVEVDRETSFALCLDTCTRAEDCGMGLACVPIDMTGSMRVCAPACSMDSECRMGQRCVIMPGEMVGECR
ncbi:MAG: hypothetical protein NZ898_01310 [Myxococcota bacterium]|nr:hypothetical protein [Myxococcota bacterium]MDW8360767.1 hypothetical protein [Myxococcales bacterium]